MNTPDLKMMLVQRVRALDVELAEDLYRRLPVLTDVHGACNYFHQLLAQYRVPTIALRATLNDQVDAENWLRGFMNEIFPFLADNRLPPCTDRAAQPIYHCESKAVLG